MVNFRYKKFKKDLANISAYYELLIKNTKQNKSIGHANEWIVDNFYLLSELEQFVKEGNDKTDYKRIKRIIELDNIVKKFLIEENYNLLNEHLYQYVNDYQIKNNIHLSYNEVSYINLFLRFEIVTKLSSHINVLKNKFLNKERIDQKLRKINNEEIDKEAVVDFESINDYYFITEFNRLFNNNGDKNKIIFEKLNSLLIENNLSIKDIIKKEQDSNTLDILVISNIFMTIKSLARIKVEDLYSQVCDTEKLLINEKAEIYDNMYEISRIEYRNEIIKQAYKKKINEYDYVKKLIDEANSNNKHVGFYLFKKANYKLRTKIYISAIVFLTLLISSLLSLYLGASAFIFLLIPIMGFVIDTINQIIVTKSSTRSLPRLKFENNLPSDYATMIVIPTLVRDKNKVNRVFDNLEIYYLSNKSNHLYFTLLADATSEKTKDAAHDEEVVLECIKACKKLNAKYGKNIFFFAYRHRFFSKSENSYLGYERKRGALLHFNSLLLNKFSHDEASKLFRANNIDDLKAKIKYVITIDEDTKLFLNTALKLIGTIAHPMNHPVLSKDGKSVIAGHAIMQPRVSVDVEVTSKSEYAQLFAGLGGLDTYATKQFDLYQDIFDEGSFIGKGIYDVEIFDKVLGSAFPENLILSHDLIEGSYLRCGYISDVEVFDGFPSRYLNDAMRHHRWTRGDWQIINWLKSKVKNAHNKLVNNPISLIGKFKIFNNLRISLTTPSLMMLLIYGFTFGKVHVGFILLIITTIITLPIFFHLLVTIIFYQKYDLLLNYYMNLIIGFLAVVNKSFITFILLPYETYLYLDAIIKALYRMYISKKNLLNWITSEEVDRTSKNTITNYLKSFMINYLAAIVLFVVTFYFKIEYLYISGFVSFVWISAPFILFFISRDLEKPNNANCSKLNEYAIEIAKKTWAFFDDLLTPELNYLIPDNYQLNRNEKIDFRTSPTNIGFSLNAIVSAYELNFIKKEVAIDKITKVITAVEKLDKWNGHLYNWYDIKTMRPIQPLFISTADGGNFIGSMYVVKGFLENFDEYDALKYRVKNIIEKADFSKLYNRAIDVFSIGYSVSEGALVKFHYSNFLSEARLASYIAIAKGEVPFKHWFSFEKTFTKYKFSKGIVSWTGTMFEYYMPLIFMKTFNHTLLDETYDFAHYTHKSFMEEVDPKLPWGITESAYNELDDAQNYKYKAFGIPYLKFNDSAIPSIVVAPYGSILAITKFPKDIETNIAKFYSLGMNGKYGLYESYDHEDREIVKVYYSHHQGMILSSLVNYLKDNVIQEYFHRDKNLRAIEILLKEKVRVKTLIDLKVEKYKKYSYKHDDFVDDTREQESIMKIPSLGVLSNGFYTCLINDRGVGFSKYKNLQINRYRKVTTDNYGTFVYIKDLSNNLLWSNTYYPVDKKPNKYHVSFSTNVIKYTREDDMIVTNTEIIVTREQYAEIRKITIRNDRAVDADIELTSYGELIIARPEEDLAHQAFNSVTIDAEVDYDKKALIFKRNSRTKKNTTYFVINRFFHEKDESKFIFEVSRTNFIGRNNTTVNPTMKMTSNINELLDPIMSIQNKVHLKPGEAKIVYLIVGFGKSKEQVYDIIDRYNNKKSIDEAFEETKILNNMRNRYANLSANELRNYNSMLKYIYQTVPVTDRRKEILKRNNMSQENLWRFGISGDLPIVLVNVDNANRADFIKEVVQAFEFYKSRALYIDIVIYNKEKSNKQDIIDEYVRNLMHRINSLNYFESAPGNIYVVKDLSAEEEILFKTIAKVEFESNLSLIEQINNLDDPNISLLETSKDMVVNQVATKTTLTNDFGGFALDGKEYVINKTNTPKPWSNILANETFGSVITNTFGGFTYAFNSREFKITNWSNDPVSDVGGEELYIDDERIVPSYVKHGFGYSEFFIDTNDYELTINVFVPHNKNVKVYEMNFKNKGSNAINKKVTLSLRPVLGVTPEKTNRHVLTEFIDNKMIMQNVYNKTFRDNRVFVTSSDTITSYDIKSVAKKSITVDTLINDIKNISFTIGLDENTNSYNIKDILLETKEYWIKKLGILEVKTPDASFDYMINGWYLYQVYVSRLYSKAAFYQVGGATGFRDQLQDSMGLLYTNQAYTKKQILKHANHQFKEGDVLHWWHEELMFGARTRFSDDYLWLIYVTYEYIKVTGDMSILEEQVGFVSGDLLYEHENERGLNYKYTEETNTLYEHLKIAVKRSLTRFGIHKLPLIGSGDWNDGMNEVGKDGLGESIWMGFFLHDILTKMANLSNDDFKELCLTKAKELKDSLNEHAWDGKWYLRAYFDNGAPLGSASNKECRIDLISQAWSIITGVANKEQEQSIIKEVDNLLVDSKVGIIKLLTPAFTGIGQNPGYIKEYLPGIRENGAQYTHAAMWYIMALIKTGDINKAYQYYQMINPANKDINTYKVEPYVIAADIYSHPNFIGQGGWTWYTGSASWAYKVGIEEIIGVKKRGNTLVVKPNFVWDKINFKYIYLDTTYNLTIYKDALEEIVILEDDKKEHNIIIGGTNDNV